jgi:hypothetical protein
MMMNDAGIVNKDIHSVTNRHIHNAAVEMATSRVYSHDLHTRDGHINTGNIAFRMTPQKQKLNVVFLDLDDVAQYQDTSNVPQQELIYLWTFLIRKCLKRPTPELDRMRYSLLSDHFLPLFP